MIYVSAAGRRIRVFKLDDCEWWAGETLQQCIDAARLEAGDPICLGKSYPNAERDGRELTNEELRTRTLIDPDYPDERTTFQQGLDDLLANPYQQFPCIFASTEV